MALYPLSDITVANLINELNANTLFSARSTAEKLQLINSVQQEIAGLYTDIESDAYKANTLSDATIIASLAMIIGYIQAIRSGSVTVNSTATTIAYDTPMPDGLTYIVLGRGLKDGISYGVDISNEDGNGFDAITSEDGIVFGYQATGV